MVSDVVIAGAGPNGLMLACELRLAGVRPVVLERLPELTTMNRANGLVGQVVRMLDRRGLYQPLAGESGPPQPMPAFFFGAVPMDLHTLDDNPFYLIRKWTGSGVRQDAGGAQGSRLWFRRRVRG
ncbi:FAD binding domain-containing protein [Kribbella steppae]|uniref:FAD binding domain-containing protein n=1 Tax=Kribbella steppae TaxID=2512223 RepID=A0A4V2RZA6_9ACTN|nr:FAD-dependent monooxygenase [Kribbella steppae]TCO24965.1 FAD binding domain-containing protein [Kribbella steppae]